MLFVRDNVRHLRKHYVELVKAHREVHFHDLIEYGLAYLPPLHGDEDKNEIDVGKEDLLLYF